MADLKYCWFVSGEIFVLARLLLFYNFLGYLTVGAAEQRGGIYSFVDSKNGCK